MSNRIFNRIPNMDDNDLRTLLLNAMKQRERKNRVDEANRVIEAIEDEWKKRLQSFDAGDYKADRPDEGLLKGVGYRVGNDGESPKTRRQLLDFIMTARAFPPVGSPAYIAEWDKPNSKERYEKLCRVIRFLARDNRHHRHKEKAVREWEDDLLYLEQVWFPKAGSGV